MKKDNKTIKDGIAMINPPKGYKAPTANKPDMKKVKQYYKGKK